MRDDRKMPDFLSTLPAPVGMLIAGETHARLFTIDKSRLRLEQEFFPADVHAEPGNDDIGRHKGPGGRRHGFQPTMASQHADALNFARDIAESLRRAEEEGVFTSLILIAAPRMLGFLRAELPEKVSDDTITEIDKNLGHFSQRALEQEFFQSRP